MWTLLTIAEVESVVDEREEGKGGVVRAGAGPGSPAMQGKVESGRGSLVWPFSHKADSVPLPPSLYF